MWSAGVEERNFQTRTEPICLFNISNIPSIVKDELAMLQQRTAVQETAEASLHKTLCCGVVIFLHQ
jgi:hypothetical protein